MDGGRRARLAGEGEAITSDLTPNWPAPLYCCASEALHALMSRSHMAEPHFDPSGMLQIDIGRGIVQLQGASPRSVVPADALVALCHEAGFEALVDFGRKWGTELGARVAGRLGADVASGSVEAWVAQLGGEWALSGLGELGFERWGKALVISIEASPLGRDGAPLMEAILAGALQRGASRDLRVVALGFEADRLRLVVLSPAAADVARQWIEGGSQWGDVLVRLHAARGDE